MTTARMSADDALALFDAPEPQDAAPTHLPASRSDLGSPSSEDLAPIGVVAHHPERGVFLGIAPGEPYGGGPNTAIAAWSRNETAGKTHAIIFLDPEAAYAYFAKTGAALPEMIADLEFFDAVNGHWSELQAIGLYAGDMPFNGYGPIGELAN